MGHKIYFTEFPCYEQATEKQKKYLSGKQYFDLDFLPSENLRREIEPFIRSRCSAIGVSTMKSERIYYEKICSFLQERTDSPDTFKDCDIQLWKQRLKAWMLKEQMQVIRKKTTIYGSDGWENSPLIRYFLRMMSFVIQSQDNRPETEKDIWRLDHLEIPFRENMVKNYKTLNFTEIQQPQIRKETKRAILHHLQHEAITTIAKELSAMRYFSKYLGERHSEILSCADLNRKVMEDFLISIKTAGRKSGCNRDTLLKLRTVLESICMLYEYEGIGNLFLKTDFPTAGRAEFRVYSDEEIKRLNAGIARMDVQYARAMIIHQMLGTRISDTLTLRRNCLFQMGNQYMITIHQMKTRSFQKPISEELARLIQKAIEDSRARYGESDYIFVNEENTARPLQYVTLQNKVMWMIQKEQIKDDSGNLMGFGTHLYRHYFGVKLTEMHVDDWTIAKLLGHKGIRSVKFYRRLSNQRLADETRKTRELLSNQILQYLKGWEEDYEQIRQNG